MLSSAVLRVAVYAACQQLAGRAPVSTVEGLTEATLQHRRQPQGGGGAEGSHRVGPRQSTRFEGPRCNCQLLEHVA